VDQATLKNKYEADWKKDVEGWEEKLKEWMD
jgi:hypothetical protein